jgi:hypothetical protein
MKKLQMQWECLKMSENNVEDLLTKILLEQAANDKDLQITGQKQLARNILGLISQQNGQGSWFKVNEVKATGIENGKSIIISIGIDDISSLTKIPGIAIIKKQLDQLRTDSSAGTAIAKDYNDQPVEIKAKYKIVSKNEFVDLSKNRISNIEISGKNLNISMSPVAGDTQNLQSVVDSFKGVLKYNFVYTGIINGLNTVYNELSKLKDGTVPEANLARQAMEIMKKNLTNNLGAIIQTTDKTFNDEFIKIAESFLEANDQPLVEEYLKYVEVYEGEIPNFFVKNMTKKFFIENLTRLYKTLKEDIDNKTLGTHRQIDTKVGAKLKQLGVDKSELYKQFLKDELDKARELVKTALIEIEKETEKEINDKVVKTSVKKSATTTTTPVTPFSIEDVKNKIVSLLNNYKLAHTKFLRRIKT